MIKINKGGFVEVKTDEILLVLTHDEYLHAMKRGDSVIRNRKLKRSNNNVETKKING